MLVFPTTTAYREALYSTTRSTEEEYLQWVQSLGMATQMSRWLQIRSQIENIVTEGIDEAQFILKEDQKFMKMRDGSPTLDMFGSTASYLVNSDGLLMIGEGLHEFTDKHHILVTDGSKQTLASAREAKESDYSLGVVYEPFVYHRGNEQNNLESDQKVQQVSITCWNSHLGQPVNTEGASGFILTDEQRVDGNRQRMSNAWIRQVQTLSGSPETRSYEVQWISTVGYTNERKQTFGWRATFPDVEISYKRDQPDDPGSIVDPLVISRWAAIYMRQPDGSEVRNDVQPTPFSDILSVPVTEDSSMPITMEGSNSAVVIIDDFTAIFNATISGTITRTKFQHIMDDGTIGARWTNRGDDPISDPISAEYFCE